MKQFRNIWPHYSPRSPVEEGRKKVAMRRVIAWLRDPNVPRELKDRLWSGSVETDWEGKNWGRVRCFCTGCEELKSPSIVALWIPKQRSIVKGWKIAGVWYGICKVCSVNRRVSRKSCAEVEERIMKALKEVSK